MILITKMPFEPIDCKWCSTMYTMGTGYHYRCNYPIGDEWSMCDLRIGTLLELSTCHVEEVLSGRNLRELSSV